MQDGCDQSECDFAMNEVEVVIGDVKKGTINSSGMMHEVTVIVPTDASGGLSERALITAITEVGMPGPQGERGPGIASNITRITASITPPANPEVNDLWIDLT
jgi:hypothetical protein